MSTNNEETSKNIIICLDGTNNQYGGNKSNVLNLFRMLERQPSKQVTYYDPGVGTLGDPAYKSAIARKVNMGLGSAFGLGLRVDPERYGQELQKYYNKADNTWTDRDPNDDHPAPNPLAKLHDESVKLGWKLDKLIRKNPESWKAIEKNGKGNAMRTIKSENDRLNKRGREERNPLLVHESVLIRAKEEVTDEFIKYAPKNLEFLERHHHRILQQLG